MKETYYFSHDYNSRSDSKIKRLLLKHGMFGYGIWWAIIEDLYSNDNSLLLDYESIAFDLHCELSIIKSIIHDFDLFNINGKSFGSNSVQMRIEIRNEKSAKARESIKARWDKTKKPEKDIYNTITKKELHTDEIDIWREDKFFLCQDKLWFSQNIVEKYSLVTKEDLKYYLEQFWLKAQKANLPQTLKQLRAGLQSYINSCEKSKKEKHNTNGKQTRKSGHDLDEADAIAREILRQHAENREHGTSDNVE